MNSVLDKEVNTFCCGCRACEASCKFGCIDIKESDSDGFLYPFLAENASCFNCGACISVCPILSPREGATTLTATGFINKGELICKSASGGAFSAISSYVLDSGGIVYGCIIDENCRVITKRATSKRDIIGMLSSKYVQCDTNRQFLSIKNDLGKKRVVLYCSTPCQIAGLKNFLKKDYDNLITMDLFCHGVPSPGLFRRYIEYLEKKYKHKITEIVFRDKSVAWGTEGYIIADKKYLFAGEEDPFYYSFLTTKTYQKICYNCPYAKSQRVGDFSIGDFWGIEHEHPEINTSNGVSAVLINSQKAQNIMNKIKGSVITFQTNVDKIRKHNHVICYPTVYSTERDNIYTAYKSLSTDKLVKNYLKLPYTTSQKLKRKIYVLIRDTRFTFLLCLYRKIKHRKDG